VVNSGVGKSSEVPSLDHAANSGETRVSKLSYSKPRLGGEKSTGTLPNFKIMETPADEKIGE
jgi:hypothetical protein